MSMAHMDIRGRRARGLEELMLEERVEKEVGKDQERKWSMVMMTTEDGGHMNVASHLFWKMRGEESPRPLRRGSWGPATGDGNMASRQAPENVLCGFPRFIPWSPHLGVLRTTQECPHLTVTAGHLSASQV